jgi:NAD(P)-dependent dehydrogenase (short-subunit alcohol dehydrogenase family)
VGDRGAPWLLVNNAGLQDRQLLLHATVAEWDRINAVNARGPFLMTRELGQAMATAGRGGRIVNIASNVLAGSLVKGQASYAASKGALLALSSVSAFELAEHSITVNTILPGPVFTPGSMASTGPELEGPRCVKHRSDSSNHAKWVWRCSFSLYRPRAPSPIRY